MYCLKLTYFLENILPVKYEFNVMAFILKINGIEKNNTKNAKSVEIKTVSFQLFQNSEGFSFTLRPLLIW